MDQRHRCETLEEFLEILKGQTGKHLPRKRTFASFEELLRILESS